MIERGPDVGEAPLTFHQELRWQRLRTDPLHRHFIGCVALRMTGPLDCSALKRALDESVARHEVLRMGILLDRPAVTIASERHLDLPVHDLSGATPAEQRQRALELAMLPLDLTREALRPQLVRTSEDEHLLLLTYNNTLMNEPSFSVLVPELAQLYNAFTAGRPSPLVPPRYQYSDFARWQRKLFDGPALEERLSRWRAKAVHCSPVLLPTDGPRDAARTGRLAIYQSCFPDDLVRALLELSRRLAVTPFVLHAAAYMALLHAQTGATELAVRTSATLARPEGTLGYFFTYSLLMSGDLSRDPSLSVLLERLATSHLDELEDQHLPVWEALPQPLRDAADVYLDTVTFGEDSALNWSGLTVNGDDLPVLGEIPARWDFMILCALEDEKRHRLGSMYNTALFATPTIEHLTSQYCRILEALAAQPEQPLSVLRRTIGRA
jgi:hypothetical protein